MMVITYIKIITLFTRHNFEKKNPYFLRYMKHSSPHVPLQIQKYCKKIFCCNFSHIFKYLRKKTSVQGLQKLYYPYNLLYSSSARSQTSYLSRKITQIQSLYIVTYYYTKQKSFPNTECQSQTTDHLIIHS